MKSEDIRKRFAIPESVAYLNCSYMGPQLKSATEKALVELQKKETPWVYTKDDFFEHVYQLQKKMAQLLNTKPENVALTPSVSYGLSTSALGALHYSKPGEILILDQQFPSNVYPWMELEKHGFQVKTLARNLQSDLTGQVLNSLSPNTKVVTLGQCHWADGHMLDLEILGKELKSRGILYVVDGIQSVGVIPTDVEKCEISYLSGGMYKWLMGPYGLSYLYVADNYCEGPSLDTTWMSRVGADDFSQLTAYSNELLPAAGRYHMGGKSSFMHIAIANEAIQFLLDQGIENICTEIKKKTSILARFFTDRGYRLIPEDFRAPHILSVKHPDGAWPEAFCQYLINHQVYVSFRGDCMRITPNIFNTDGDLERFQKVVGEAL